MLLNIHLLGGSKAHAKNVQTHLAIVARAKDLSKSPAAEGKRRQLQGWCICLQGWYPLVNIQKAIEQWP